MNFNFTDRTRKVLAMTREEAIRLQHDHVETEHILLALIREGEGIAAAVLTSLSGDLERIRERTEGSVRRGTAAIALRELPYAPRGKMVLEHAMKEARELGHSYVGTEHLLLGLLRGEEGIAARVLAEFGVTLEDARRETIRLLDVESSDRAAGRGEGVGWFRRLLGERSEPAPAAGSRFAVVIDDTSSSSIYEQIVAQVQEAVATGRLRAGDRLPTVRRLAEDLDIAPGTVARAYGELERVGVVVTEGTRGTRVAERPTSPLSKEKRPDTLVGLLRPVAVAAFHLGASGAELRAALERAMQGIFPEEEEEPARG